MIHKAKHLIHHHRVFVGDSSIKQLANIFHPSYFLGKEETNLTEVIREASEVVFSTNVQTAIVMVGRDALLSGQTVEQIIEETRRLKQILERFEHIHIIWLPPPYIRQKHNEYEDLIQKLVLMFKEEESENFEFITTTKTGRSFLELTRFGNSFNGQTIDAEGKLKQQGIEAIKAWLVTQVPNFPGDHELGVRTIRSRVNVVHREEGNRREHWTCRGLGDQNPRSHDRNQREHWTGRGLGDQNPRSHGQDHRIGRERGLGDRTPYRSSFDRSRRSPYRYSRHAASRSRERT